MECSIIFWRKKPFGSWCPRSLCFGRAPPGACVRTTGPGWNAVATRARNKPINLCNHFPGMKSTPALVGRLAPMPLNPRIEVYRSRLRLVRTEEVKQRTLPPKEPQISLICLGIFYIKNQFRLKLNSFVLKIFECKLATDWVLAYFKRNCSMSVCNGLLLSYQLKYLKLSIYKREASVILPSINHSWRQLFSQIDFKIKYT